MSNPIAYDVIRAAPPGIFSATKEVAANAQAPESPWVRLSAAEFAAETAPAVPARQSTGTVLRRLTNAERAALHAARSVSWQIDYFVALAYSEGVIDSADPDFGAAVSALNDSGIILSARWDALLAP